MMGTLCAHTDTITCVAVCRSIGIIVTGSKDCSALLWDLHRLVLIKQLPTRGSVAPSSVSISDISGNILVSAGNDLDLFSVNGDLLATINMTSPAISLLPPSCATLTSCPEYVDGVVAVTGHPDGAIVLWGVLYPSDVNVDGKLRSSKISDVGKYESQN
jgi:WD40 repeat protein